MKFNEKISKSIRQDLIIDYSKLLIWSGQFESKQDYAHQLKQTKIFSSDERKIEVEKFIAIKSKKPLSYKSLPTNHNQSEMIKVILRAVTYADALVCAAEIRAINTVAKLIDENTDPKELLLEKFKQGLSAHFLPYQDAQPVNNAIILGLSGGCNSYKQSLLLGVIDIGEIEHCVELFDRELVDDINNPINENGTTIIQYAIKVNASPEIITLLLEHGAMATTQDKSGHSAISLTITDEKYRKYFPLLLEKTHPEQLFNHNKSLLEIGLESNVDDIIEQLLNKNPKLVNHRSTEFAPRPLVIAARLGKLSLAVKMISTWEADIHFAHTKDLSFLDFISALAVFHLTNQADIKFDYPITDFISFLIGKRLNLQKECHKMMALMIEANQILLVKKLVHTGYKINEPKQKKPPLLLAVIKEKFEIVKFFIDECSANIEYSFDALLSDEAAITLFRSILEAHISVPLDEFSRLYYGFSQNEESPQDLTNKLIGVFIDKCSRLNVPFLIYYTSLVFSAIKAPVQSFPKMRLIEILLYVLMNTNDIEKILTYFLTLNHDIPKIVASLKDEIKINRADTLLLNSSKPKLQDNKPLIEKIIADIATVNKFKHDKNLTFNIPKKYQISADQLSTLDYNELLPMSLLCEQWASRTIARQQKTSITQDVENPVSQQSQRDNYQEVIHDNTAFQGISLANLVHTTKVENNDHLYLYFDPKQIVGFDQLSPSEQKALISDAKKPHVCGADRQNGLKITTPFIPCSLTINNQEINGTIRYKMKRVTSDHRILLMSLKPSSGQSNTTLLLAIACYSHNDLKRLASRPINNVKITLHNKQDAISVKNEGNILAKQGEVNQALKKYNQAISIDPNLSAAWFNKGLMHKKLGENESALAAFNNAIEIDPTYTKAVANKTEILLLLNQPSAILTYN